MKSYINPEAHWADYWQNKTCAQHKEFQNLELQYYAAELASLCPDVSNCKVLELGCGDGELFNLLNFGESKSYLGVDFSESMLNQFRSRVPAVQLIHADATKFIIREKFDLIFANGMIQYVSKVHLPDFFSNCSTMLTQKGMLVIGSVPWQVMRVDYYRGLFGSKPTSKLFAYLTLFKRMLSDPMGYWYCPSTLATIARGAQLDCKIHGSLSYPYRFHLTCRP